MIIHRKPNRPLVRLSSVHFGSTFLYNHELYVLADPMCAGENCILLGVENRNRNDTLRYIPTDTMVEVVMIDEVIITKD